METAYVLVSCDLGFEVDIIQELKSIDSVMEVQGVYGAYDIIAKIENPNREKLREIIISNIRKLKHVRSTLTLMGISGQAWREN
ncbi:MAG: Lrp/AsnC ligand binding domain-containing protein [Nitrosopumilus sp.]|nr:Lrp/AsnC ligand binding domain-containing protein [Nitrosopumilus sp.]MDH3341694.1 Lrp/AsnC ligand binding domain-containing protein [Nitrosopumilus sp.]